MYCMFCGNIMEDQSKECPRCGTLAENTAPAEEYFSTSVLKKIKAGDSFYYGRNEALNPLEWIALEVSYKGITAITKEIIANRIVHDDRWAPQWNGSDLIKWLNRDFYRNCFTTKEKSMILPYCPNVYDYDDFAGTHYVNLLSKEEFDKYAFEALTARDTYWLCSLNGEECLYVIPGRETIKVGSSQVRRHRGVRPVIRIGFGRVENDLIKPGIWKGRKG